MKSIEPKQLFNKIKQNLQQRMQEQEAAQHAYLLLEHFAKLNRKDMVLNRPISLPEQVLFEMEGATNRLLTNEPIQYVTGIAHFYGYDFSVNEHVLIPRPETEELVYRIAERHKLQEKIKILDIGTGSGCIPISLKLELPDAEVFALDVSKGALAVAKKNAETLGAELTFLHQDVLKGVEGIQELDVLVSNPPYISKSESALMEKNVLDYEPHLALFVEDDDPLLFYNTITAQAIHLLKQGGWLYFEINEGLGEETAAILKEKGFKDVLVVKDMQGKNRIVEGRL